MRALQGEGNGEGKVNRPISPRPEHGGWIDVSVCEALLTKPLKFVCAVDGSDPSMVGLHLLTEGIMQKNRETSCEVLHVYDESKDYLPPALRPDALKQAVEAKLTGALSEKRYKTKWVRKDGMTAARHLHARCKDNQADFCILGWTGRHGNKKDKNLVASNVQEALQTVSCAVVVMRDESPQILPLKRPSKFVVSVSLNKASTKAFLDALRMSSPGDEIHVVYVKCFMERTDSDYTAELRGKYAGFFEGLKGAGEMHAFSKFHDRKTVFEMIKKQRRETTAQAVVRYGDEIEADFLCVGTNTLRVQKGKKPLGSVSLDICMEWDRNFIVSHWVDLSGELYDKYGSQEDNREVSTSYMQSPNRKQ